MRNGQFISNVKWNQVYQSVLFIAFAYKTNVVTCVSAVCMILK